MKNLTLKPKLPFCYEAMILTIWPSVVDCIIQFGRPELVYLSLNTLPCVVNQVTITPCCNVPYTVATLFTKCSPHCSPHCSPLCWLTHTGINSASHQLFKRRRGYTRLPPIPQQGRHWGAVTPTPHAQGRDVCTETFTPPILVLAADEYIYSHHKQFFVRQLSSRTPLHFS